MNGSDKAKFKARWKKTFGASQTLHDVISISRTVNKSVTCRSRSDNLDALCEKQKIRDAVREAKAPLHAEIERLTGLLDRFGIRHD